MYRFEGRQRTLAIGPYPTVGLAAARLQREQAKLDLQAGRDPGGKPEAPPASVPFKEVVNAWYEHHAIGWVPGYAARVLARLKGDVLPALGGTPVDEVTAEEVLAMLRAVEGRGSPVMAARLRQHLDQIFRWHYRRAPVKRNPAADVRMDLKPRSRREVKRRARLPAKEMGVFLDKVQHYDGEEVTRLALETIIRTAVRVSELRLGVWEEVDGDLWRIPAGRMKIVGVEPIDHLVPIVPQVRQLLDRAREIGGGSRLMFPGEKGKELSLNTLIFAIYRLGYKSRATVHGMRAVFSTWANEQARWPSDAIERQLAHWPRDSVKAAYDAAEYLGIRREILAEWNQWLDRQLETARLL